MSQIARHAARTTIARLSRARPVTARAATPSASLLSLVNMSSRTTSREASTASWSSSSSQQQQQPAQPEKDTEQGQDERPAGTAAADKALPAPGEGSDVTTLDVSGEGTTVKLGALGPLVVNQDGTMSRISNWAEMTDIERQNTLRILGKRNKLRLATLRESQNGGDGSSSNN